MPSLNGCKLGPNFKRPESRLPDQWNQLPPEEQQKTLQLANWWTSFGDSTLESLVTRALQSNYDLKIATVRIREARSAEYATRADFWPSLNMSGAYQRVRNMKTQTTPQSVHSGALTLTQKGAGVSFTNTIAPGLTMSASPDLTGAGNSSVTLSGALPGKGAPDRENDLFRGGFDASWEIDVFGAIRRRSEAAKADLKAAEENQRDIRVILAAEVARNYFTLRSAQSALDIINSNLEIQQKTLELVQARFDAGLSNELDVHTAKAQLESSQALKPTAEIQIEHSINRLCTLLGQNPGALGDELRPAAALPENPPLVPIGLPSELLQRRPDIRRAEQELAAATARIGAAKADLFPKFSLTGSFTGQSDALHGIKQDANHLWAVGPAIQWPIFDGGRIRANIRIQNARQEETLCAYERTVISSMEDVENALTAYAKEQLRLQSLMKSKESSSRALLMAKDLYTQGLVTFLNVLEAQRSLIVTDQQITESRAAILMNLVSLYKALGGGWEEAPSDPEGKNAPVQAAETNKQ